MPTYEAPTRKSVSATRDTFATDRVFRIVYEILARRSAISQFTPFSSMTICASAGLTSLDMVNLMLAVEAEFELKIPDTDMTLRNFRSVSAIDALVASLIRDE